MTETVYFKQFFFSGLTHLIFNEYDPEPQQVNCQK